MYSPANSLIDTQSPVYPQLYKQRWLILIALCWLNLTNGILWISYASVSDQMTQFYRVSLDNINYLSLVFPVVTIVLGLPAIWGIDRFGLRVTCITCGWLNLASALLRFFSSYKGVSGNHGYEIALIGQIIGSLAQPLAMFSPAKLASLWFPSHQRALATTIGAMGNPLGILLGSLLPPFILLSYSPFDVSCGILVISFISALLPTLGIYQSRPPIPPAVFTDRPIDTGPPFKQQLRLCVSSLPFIVLALTFGMGLGLFTGLSTLLEQILCPFGYSDQFAGLCGALLIGFGLVGSLISGLLADKTKAFTEIVQFCIVCTTFGIIAFSILTQYAKFQIAIAASVSVIGAFGIALYSVALELAAEISFPVSENISTGLLVVSGQIFSVVFILLSQVLWAPFQGIVNRNCSNTSSDSLKNYWRFNIFMSSTAVLGSTMMLLGFSAEYFRRATETTYVNTQEHYNPDIEQSISR